MKTKRVHFIKTENDWIAFFCDTVSYKKLTAQEKTCYDMILGGQGSDAFYASCPSADEGLYNQCLQDLEEKGEIAEKIQQDAVRLTLNVANSCNMNCGYCYANGGVYHSAENLMSFEVAKRALDHFAEKYHVLGSVKFIGGEPLVNKEVVFQVCDYVKQLCNEGKLEKMPDFIMATNGTILDEKIIQYSNIYKWRVSLSFDGPELIHGQVRTFRNGTSTVDTIKKNIARWQRETDGRCPSSINACYNGVHQKNGVSLVDAIKYMKDELGVKKINIVPVDASKDSSFALTDTGCFVAGVRQILDRESPDYRKYVFTKMNKLEKILRAHLSMPQQICKAGLSTFGVSAKGDITPCHLLTDEKYFYMGSVYDQSPLESEAFRMIQERLRTYNRYEKENCRDCFVNRICIGCLGGNAFRTGDYEKGDPVVCSMLRGATEEILKDIVREESTREIL